MGPGCASADSVGGGGAHAGLRLGPLDGPLRENQKSGARPGKGNGRARPNRGRGAGLREGRRRAARGS